MANTLMFSVGIENAKNAIDQVKTEIKAGVTDINALLKLKVTLDGADKIISELDKIGQDKSLKSLREEITKLNEQFAQLAKGAGGTGSINVRGIEQEIEKQQQKLERYKNTLDELTQKRNLLQGGRLNANYKPLSEDIDNLKLRIEGVLSSIRGLESQLEQAKNAGSSASSGLKAIDTASIETKNKVDSLVESLAVLKGGMNINLSGDFAKWAQEVQAVTTSVKDLVAELQKMNTASATSANGSPINSGFNVWIEQQLEAAERFVSVNKEIEKVLKTKLNSSFLTYTDFLQGGDKEESYMLAKLKKDVLSAYSKISDEQGLAKLRDEIKQIDLIISKTEEKVANGKISASVGNRDLVVFEERLRLLKEIEKQATVTAQAEQKSATQGGIFEPQKFTSLQDAIDKIIGEINRLQQAFTRLGENSSLSNLSTQVNGLAITLSSLSNAVKFTGSSEEIAAYEAKVKGLKETIAQLEAQAKQVAESVANATKGISTQAEKKGSESVLADNLQKLKTTIADVKAEYNRLNEAYGQGKAMGMPTNDAIEQRLFILRQLIKDMEYLSTAAQNAGSDIAVALSKAKAFSFIKFNGNQLFSKENTRLYNKKEIDGYIKMVDEFVKAEGRMAQTTGSATTTIAEIGTALSRASERASNAGFSFSQTAQGIQNFALNVETARLAYEKTLRGIADLENRISAGQKAGMDKESIEFMNGLKQRAQQWADVLKRLLGEDLQGNPAYREFLSMSSSILTKPQFGNGLQALLGADWKILLKNIGDTFGMLMKFSGFNKELTLDNATITNWQKGEEAVRRLENALKDLNNQWSSTNKEAKTPALTAKYEEQKLAIESRMAQIKGAMMEVERMSNRNGLVNLLDASYKNAVGYDNTRLIQEMKAASSEYDKTAKAAEKAAEKEARAAERTAETERKINAQRLADDKRVQDSIAKKETAEQKAANAYEQWWLKALERKETAEQKAADKSAAANMKAAENEARKLTETISNLEALASKAGALGVDTTKIRSVIDSLKGYRDVMNDITQNNSKNTKATTISEDFLNLKRTVKEVAQEIKKDMTAALKPNTEQSNAMKEYVSLMRQITSLTKTSNKAEVLGIDTQMLRNQIALLENYAKIIERFLGNKGAGFDAWMQANPVYGEARGNIAADQAKMNKEIANAKQTNTAATNQLSESEQRLANAIKSSTDSMKGQSQVLSDLKMMAMQYVSVWGAQSFVNSIIETGGKLEQQRLSLSAILGDMEKATTLFGQIKQMALKSPFGVVELDQMSKQLAAYSFEYEELFEWTKRLADISAATGTSVDRLALALGHVRSEGALSGYTLRQFAMANVPVLRMLSQNLGISSKEVRERVRKKEISAEDVQNILKQLTDDGGMFANAQETMSEALNAKYKNLRDAFDIMYGEIAEGGVGDALKKLAETLTAGAKHWERLGKDVLAVAASIGIGKVAMLAYNSVIGQGTAATLRSAMASKKKEIANLELTASYRKLTIAELRTMANEGKLNATNIATLISTNKLTVAQLERAVAMGRVSKADAVAAMNLLQLNTAQMKSVKVFGTWGRIWQTIVNGARMAGLAIKSFMASIAPLLALTAAFEIWNRRSEQKDAAKDLASSMAGNVRGKEAYELYGNIKDVKQLTEAAIEEDTEQMIEALKAADAYTESLKNQLDAIDNAVDKYVLLRDKLGDVAEEYENLKATQESMLQDAWDAGGGFFSDNMLEDAKQYDVARAEYVKAVVIGSKQIKDTLVSWMRIQGLYKDEFAGMTGKQLLEQLSQKDLNRFLAHGDRNIYQSRGYDKELQGVLRNIAIKGSDAAKALNEMAGKQGEEFADTLRSMYEEAFRVDLDNATDEQKIAFDKWLRGTLERAEGLSEDARERLRQITIGFTIQLVPKYEIIHEKTAEEVVEETLGDNMWLHSFFNRQNPGAAGGDSKMVAVMAENEAKLYDKLLGEISLANLDTAAEKINKELDTREETIENLSNSLKSSTLSEDEKSALTTAKETAEREKGILEAALADINGQRKRKGESKEDVNAKAVRERVRVIKEAADAFEYWRNKVGESGAWAHVQSEFGDVLKTIGITADNIEDVRVHLNNIKNTAEFKAIKDSKVKTEISKEIAKENDQAIRKEFEKSTSEFLSRTQKQLDDLTRSWETFNSVREATGNVSLAEQISGAQYANGQNRNIADELKKRIEDDFMSAGSVGIPFDINLDDKAVEESIKKAIPAESEERIQALVEEYKKWRDLQRDVLKNDIEVFASLIGAQKDYDSELMKINSKLEKQKQSISELVKLRKISTEEASKALLIAQAEADAEAWEKSVTYATLMNDSLALTRQEIESGINRAMEILNEKMNANLITAQEYASEMMKIDQIQKDWSKNSLFGIGTRAAIGAKGGLDALVNYQKSKVSASQANVAYYTQKRDNARNAADFMEAVAMLESEQIGLGKNQDEYNRLDSLKTLFEDFEALGKVLDPVINLFDKLGMSALGNILGAGQNALSSASSMGAGAAALFGASAGPWGAIAGAGVSLLGSALSLFGADYSSYEKAKEEYQKLIGVWDDLIDRKRTYMNESWGTEATNAAKESIKLIQAEIAQTKILAKERLDAGASLGSHSIRYRMWEGSYDYNGRNWRDVAGSISSRFGVRFNNMDDLLNMTSDQLLWIKENYTGLWAKMDSEFKEHLENIIKYGDDIQDILDDVDEKLNGLSFDNLIDSYYNFVTASEDANDVLAEDLEGKLKEAIVKGMIENLYRDKINAFLAQASDLGKNGAYVDSNGNIRQHVYGANGTIADQGNVASEYTKEEYSLLMQVAQSIGDQQKATYEMLKGMYDWTDGESKSSGLSKSIKGFTESQADLLSSYVNSIRADVSINKGMIAEYFPQYLSVITSGNENLRNIENNTAAIMRSNEAIMESNAQLYSLFSGLRNKTWKVPVA